MRLKAEEESIEILYDSFKDVKRKLVKKILYQKTAQQLAILQNAILETLCHLKQ